MAVSSDVVWLVVMALFIAVNTHAMHTSCHTLWLEATMRQRSQCDRKRARAHDADGSDAVWMGGHAYAQRCHGKRRKLACCHGLSPRRVFAREIRLWAWPRHVAFGDAQDSELMRLGSKLLMHPAVTIASTKLKQVVENAIEELLVSCLSFVLCALAVLVLRTYSSLVVGVSVDLGAFSVDI